MMGVPPGMGAGGMMNQLMIDEDGNVIQGEGGMGY